LTAFGGQALAGDADIGDRLPIPTDTMQIFDECKGSFSSPVLESHLLIRARDRTDGLLLAKLINDAVPDTIDERVLNKASKSHKRTPSAMPAPSTNKAINAFQMVCLPLPLTPKYPS
jgi:plastin-1